MDRLIRQYDGWEDASAADLLAWMAEETTELVANQLKANQLRTLPEIGDAAVSALCNALEAAGKKDVVMTLCAGDGLNFGLPLLHERLDQLGQALEAFAPYVGALKALGQDTRTRWARVYGDEPLPDESAVALARQQMLSTDWRDSTLLPLVDSAINAGKSVEQIKAEIAG